MIDFNEDAPVVTQEQLSLVTLRAQQLLDQKQAVEHMEALLKDAQQRLRQTEEFDLPDAMAAAGMKEFKLLNGSKVTVKDVVSGSPSKTRFNEALSWLSEHNHDGIVKRQVGVIAKFRKGQADDADALAEALSALLTTELKKFDNLEVTDEPSIHYQTFGSWARELHVKHNEEHSAGEQADDCPFCKAEVTKLLGIYVGKKAEVK